MSKPSKISATAVQKQNFLKRFSEITVNNEMLNDKFKVCFFETESKTNYVINGVNGKSINVINLLSLEETAEYKALKSNWQKLDSTMLFYSHGCST